MIKFSSRCSENAWKGGGAHINFPPDMVFYDIENRKKWQNETRMLIYCGSKKYSYQFHILCDYIKWVTIYWTHSMTHPAPSEIGMK